MRAKILVCEDRDVLRSLIREALADDYHVVEARDGHEALALARSVRPDLVLLDLVLPGQSGLDVLEALQADPLLAEIPVVLMTGSTKAIDRAAAAEFGAVGFVPKPFSPSELVAKVEGFLQAASKGANR